MLEERTDRQPGIEVARGGLQRIERRDEDQAVERAVLGEARGDAAADAEADRDVRSGFTRSTAKSWTSGASASSASADGLPVDGR